MKLADNMTAQYNAVKLKNPSLTLDEFKAGYKSPTIQPQIASLTPDTTPPLQGRNLAKEQEAMTKLGVSGARATALMENPLFAKQVYEMAYTPQELPNVKEYNDIKANEDQRSQLQQKTQQMQQNAPNAMLALEDALRTKSDIGQQALGESELFKSAGLSGNVFNLQQSLNQNLQDMSARYGSFTNALSRASSAMANQYQGLSSSYKTLTDEYQNQYAALNQTLDKIAQHDEAMSLAEKEAQLQQDVLKFKSKLDDNTSRFQPVVDPVLGGLWTFDKVTGKYTRQGDAIPTGTQAGGESASAGTTQTAAVSNNNPGNIKIPAAGLAEAQTRYNDPGATAGSMATDGGQFIKFSTPEIGASAIPTLLSTVYNGMDVGDALHKWSNNGYGIEIVPELSGKKIGSLTQEENALLAKRMIQNEDANMYSQIYGGGTVAQVPSILGQANVVATTGGQGVNPATAKPLTSSDVHKLAVKAGYDIKQEAQVVDQFNRTGQIPDELTQVRQYGKILTSADKVQADAFLTVNNKIKILEDNLNLVPGGNASNFTDAVKNTVAMKWLELQARMFKFPPDVVNYLATRDGMSAAFARAGGEKGALSDKDIERATALLPEITDSLELRQKKLATLRKVMSAINKDYTDSGTDMFTEIKDALGEPVMSDATKVEYKGGGRAEAISILNSQGWPATEENIDAIINTK